MINRTVGWYLTIGLLIIYFWLYVSFNWLIILLLLLLFVAIYLYHNWLNVIVKINTKTFIAELYFIREKTWPVTKIGSIKHLPLAS